MKIRGKRIEPAEIEARLLEMEGVQEAAVTMREIDGEGQLYAHYVGDDKRTEKEIRADLARVLPDYMIRGTGCVWSGCRLPETEK